MTAGPGASLPAEVVVEVVEDAYMILDEAFTPRPGCCADCDELLDSESEVAG